MGLKFDRFAGLIPRTPPELLPDLNATVAENCDFAYGELRSLPGNLTEHTLADSATSLYTDDGVLFYTWPVDVNAVRSPMANDTFNRLYYTTPDDIRVASRSAMSVDGGEPPSSYRVGVPKPATAPTLTAVADEVVIDVGTNSEVLPVHDSGPGDPGLSGFEYHAGAGMGSVIATVSITLPVAGSVAALITFQSQSYSSGDNFNVRVEVEADSSGTPFLAHSDSGTAGMIESHFTSAAVTLAAGTHTFEVRFGNDWIHGWWYLGPWSLTVMPVQLVGEVLPGGEAAVVTPVTRAYVWTHVNVYGEEGPPSPPTQITFTPGSVNVGIDYVVPTDPYAPLKEVRIYRTPDSGGIAEYFYVGMIDVLGAPDGPLVFSDTVAAAELNESLASTYYYPPDPELVGLTLLPNGILMAWKGNELHFSDAYRPWAWPPAYVLTFGDYQIVGAIPVGASCLITTTGKPYLVSGVSPDAMTHSVLNIQQAGVSKWSLADLGGQIVYASHDGIVAFDGGLPSMAFSDLYFTRDVWRTRFGSALASMRFAVWDGRLIVYCPPGEGAFTPFMVRLDEARGAMTELPELVGQGSFVSPVADACFMVNGADLQRVAGGTPMELSWTSRRFVLRRPCNYSVAQAVCSGSWEVKFYADGVLRHTESGLNGNVTFCLPAGFLADRWQIAITGTGTFTALMVAESVDELKAM